MRNHEAKRHRRPAGLAGAAGLLLACWACGAPPPEEPSRAAPATQPSAGAVEEKPHRTVRGRMQARPGGPVEEIEVAVHEAPVDPPTVPAGEAALDDGELVLGVEVDGQAVAYPVKFLALTEIVDHRIGDLPVAPTW